MGRNLLLNMADHGFAVVGFDLDGQKTALLESSASPGTTVKGFNTLAEMVQALEKPRKMMMLVPAGKPVDDVIQSLLPLLEKGDIVIDGGNSHYTDTLRRVTFMEGKGFHFMGCGISGGEQGARVLGADVVGEILRLRQDHDAVVGCDRRRLQAEEAVEGNRLVHARGDRGVVDGHR